MNSNKFAIVALCVAFLALGVSIAALYTANKNSLGDMMKDSMKLMEKYESKTLGPIPTKLKD